MPQLTVLLLGGTTQGRALAQRPLPGIRLISSLAGRTTAPLLPHGEVRIGGFGGIPGLVTYLRTAQIGAIVDATHPFAATMSAHAAAAAAETGVPLLVLKRPGWTARPGDDWRRVPSMAAAADLVATLGGRIFLTTGRQTIGAFAAVHNCWFLARSVEPPERPVPGRLEVLLDRGPFTLDGELALLRNYRITALVTKDSGGTAPKLAAARDLALPVVMVDRPLAVSGTSTVETVEDALSWLTSIPGTTA
jgi:precorrin-6A/cobalt-precorrin-6A reductase